MAYINLGDIIAFIAGTKAKSSEVNTNFETLRVGHNNHEGRLITLEGSYVVPVPTYVNNTDYTVLTTDYLIYVTTGAVDRTMNLPDASTMTNKQITVVKVDVGVGQVIIDGYTSQTINGNLTLRVASRYGFTNIISDGSNWIVLYSPVWQ
jgi:hypothetical protein